MPQPLPEPPSQAPVAEPRATLIPATVKTVVPGRVVLELEGQGSVHARVAVPAPYAPRAGDSVLAAPGPGGEWFVVGVLVALREAAPLVLRDGTSATVSESPEGEVLSVRDNAGRLVFEHHAGAGRSVVHAPAGNLELRADQGGILLSARDTVRVHSAREVRVESDHAVKVQTTPAAGRPASSLAMDARGARLATPHLEARANKARVELDEGSLTARALSTTCHTARHTVDVLEVQAGRILERAENVYREVKDLAQTHAGRVRLVAETTFHLLGRRTLFKAREDLKLKADKIHLA